ncbi:hypothetical protein ES705_37004 [subsurface metagenome]
MKIPFSPFLAGVRGIAAGAGALTWPARAHVRERGMLANPRTATQTAGRESLARCASPW